MTPRGRPRLKRKRVQRMITVSLETAARLDQAGRKKGRMVDEWAEKAREEKK